MHVVWQRAGRAACAPVVQHDVCCLHAPQRMESEQPGVARAGAHQVHLARAAAWLICSTTTHTRVQPAETAFEHRVQRAMMHDRSLKHQAVVLCACMQKGRKPARWFRSSCSSSFGCSVWRSRARGSRAAAPLFAVHRRRCCLLHLRVVACPCCWLCLLPSSRKASCGFAWGARQPLNCPARLPSRMMGQRSAAPAMCRLASTSITLHHCGSKLTGYKNCLCTGNDFKTETAQS